MNLLYKCPICKSNLMKDGNSLKCINNHCFDISKSGYVNLLIKKHSKVPGDNKALVKSRVSFLEKGKYIPLSDEINKTIFSFEQKESIIDCGCGSGYYLERINQYFINKATTANMIGFDISREAIQVASKRSTQPLRYAISSVFNLPILDNNIDVILSIFAPYAITEFHRVLKKGGHCIVVYPAAFHLIELKKAIYGDKTYENNKNIDFTPFSDVKMKTLKYIVELDSNEEVINLFEMTPYSYKTSLEAKEKLSEINNISLTLHFNIAILTK